MDRMFRSILTAFTIATLFSLASYWIGVNRTQKEINRNKIYLTLQDTACKNPGKILDPAMLVNK